MVATQQAQLGEINAVIGPQGLGEPDPGSTSLEVRTESRGIDGTQPRYNLIDVVDEMPEGDQGATTGFSSESEGCQPSP